MSSKAFKILVVEDESDFSDYIIEKLKRISPQIEFTVADSRDQAFSYIRDRTQFFDFITLDLNIPIQSRGFEKSPQNGLAVLGECKVNAKGTPILVFTGTSTLEMISSFLESSHLVDVWAEGSLSPSVSHLTKTQLDIFSEKIEKAFNAVEALSDIELIISQGTSLPIEDDRLIRIFVKTQSGVKTEIQTIGGGYSDARVYKLHIKDERGNTIHKAVAKCGTMTDISTDASNYDQKINRLEPSVTPRKLKHISFGAKSTEGVFYGLATDFNYSFFEAVKSGLVTPEIRQFICEMTKPWQNAANEAQVRIKDIRCSLINDEKVIPIIEEYNLDWINEFEQKVIQANQGCYHGDLHGENILVDVETKCTNLIDYGDISFGSLAIDPITLECSFLFHKDGIGTTGWPLIENLENWENIDKYVEGCPIEDEIRFCRQWAERVQAGNRDLAACLYSYALRQLQEKYKETDKNVAIELINAARRIINNS